MADVNEGQVRRGFQGGRRTRQATRRECEVSFRLSREEFAVLIEAAGRAGRSRGAYAAEVSMAAATGNACSPDADLRDLLHELIRASGLVRRIGVNLNQAVARLNKTGEHSADLEMYAAESTRRSRYLDAVADKVRKALR